MRVAKARGAGGELLFVFGIALAAGLAYYMGSLAGLQLRLPPATPSVLWPPNSILTGALLVAPTRLWPAVLLGALPAHLAAQLTTEWPVSLAGVEVRRAVLVGNVVPVLHGEAGRIQ